MSSQLSANEIFRTVRRKEDDIEGVKLRKWTQIFSQRMGLGFLFADRNGGFVCGDQSRTSEFEQYHAGEERERRRREGVQHGHGVATRARFNIIIIIEKVLLNCDRVNGR